MVGSFSTRVHRHVYWELCFDALIDKTIWKILKKNRKEGAQGERQAPGFGVIRCLSIIQDKQDDILKHYPAKQDGKVAQDGRRTLFKVEVETQEGREDDILRIFAGCHAEFIK